MIQMITKFFPAPQFERVFAPRWGAMPGAEAAAAAAQTAFPMGQVGGAGGASRHTAHGGRRYAPY